MDAPRARGDGPDDPRQLTGGRCCSPRRGDGPTARTCGSSQVPCSPLARGWTRPQLQRKGDDQLLPARVLVGHNVDGATWSVLRQLPIRPLTVEEAEMVSSSATPVEHALLEQLSQPAKHQPPSPLIPDQPTPGDAIAAMVTLGLIGLANRQKAE